jgi:hypothetical protein
MSCSICCPEILTRRGRYIVPVVAVVLFRLSCMRCLILFAYCLLAVAGHSNENLNLVVLVDITFFVLFFCIRTSANTDTSTVAIFFSVDV